MYEPDLSNALQFFLHRTYGTHIFEVRLDPCDESHGYKIVRASGTCVVKRKWKQLDKYELKPCLLALVGTNRIYSHVSFE